VDVPEIDVEVLAERRAAGAPVFDVRQPHEYDDTHVPGAVLVPLAEVPDRVAEFPTDRPFYVICRSGGRSHTAAHFLLEHGRDATNVAGGTLAWVAAGKPTVTGPEPG
jgi:rhodanese-related sulfurtransferase